MKGTADELPFTNSALKIYIEECEKEMDKLSEAWNKYKTLNERREAALKRLKSHGG